MVEIQSSIENVIFGLISVNLIYFPCYNAYIIWIGQSYVSAPPNFDLFLLSNLLCLLGLRASFFL